VNSLRKWEEKKGSLLSERRKEKASKEVRVITGRIRVASCHREERK
jgi:hypothetical protein